MTDQPDWSYLSYHLATMGIPSDIYEDIATNPEDDPWMPPDGAEIVLVAITKEDAGRLAALVKESTDPRNKNYAEDRDQEK